ncbi:MAG: ABC transporter permease [Petrotogales bacterium]
MNKTTELIKAFITIAISLVIGIITISFTSSEPLTAIDAFFRGPFSNSYFFGNMLASSIPLILTGLAASIAFSASAFNLGLEGQLYFSALAGTFVAIKFSSLPSFPLITIVLVVSAFVGGLIAAFSGYLKSKWNVNELISSLLVSYTLIYITDFFLEGPFKDPVAGLSASPYFSEELMLSKILSPSNLHTGIFIAVGIVIFMYFVCKKSNLGFEICITGRNRYFSRYAGISVGKIIVISMMISGILAGLAGMIDVFGIHGRVIRGFSAGYGWNGIAVALLARSNPLLVIPAALFFAFLESGANVGSLLSDITPEVARIIQAVVFYLVTAEGLLSFIKSRKKVKIDD